MNRSGNFIQGRSVEELIRQQQAQRQSEIQQQQARERLYAEQREKARLQFLERNRVFEKIVPIGSPNSDASAAGGSRPAENTESYGSMTFNGVDQYVLLPSAQSTGWVPGTGDFTLEWFMKKQGPTAGGVFSLGTLGCTILTGGLCYVWPYGAQLAGTFSTSYYAETSWAHVAISRSGTTTKLFVEGILKSTKTLDTLSIDADDFFIGKYDPSSQWMSGNITNFRWTNSALYTGSSLVVPTSPLTNETETKLLLLGGNTDNPVIDSSGINTLINNGAGWDADTPFV